MLFMMCWTIWHLDLIVIFCLSQTTLFSLMYCALIISDMKNKKHEIQNIFSQCEVPLKNTTSEKIAVFF